MLIALSPADDFRDDEPGEKLGHRLDFGLVDMAAQAGKLLDYSAHAGSRLPLLRWRMC